MAIGDIITAIGNIPFDIDFLLRGEYILEFSDLGHKNLMSDSIILLYLYSSKHFFIIKVEIFSDIFNPLKFWEFFRPLKISTKNPPLENTCFF